MSEILDIIYIGSKKVNQMGFGHLDFILSPYNKSSFRSNNSYHNKVLSIHQNSNFSLTIKPAILFCGSRKVWRGKPRIVRGS